MKKLFLISAVFLGISFALPAIAAVETNFSNFMLIPSNINVGDKVTAQGWLEDKPGTGLADKQIDLQCSSGNGQVINNIAHKNTSSDGYVSFPWTPDSSWTGQVWCKLVFAGDSNYSSSQSLPPLSISIATPTITQGFIRCGVGNSTDPGYRACGLCDIVSLINTILIFFLWPDLNNPNHGFPLVPIVATIFIIIGGIRIMLGGGNPATLAQGQKILLSVAVGLGIIYLSWLALSVLFQAIGVYEWAGFSHGWQALCK